MIAYSYDAEAQAAYLGLCGNEVASTAQVGNDVYLDLSSDGSVIGCEMLAVDMDTPTHVDIMNCLHERGVASDLMGLLDECESAQVEPDSGASVTSSTPI
jgi:uncharacterized protein YuzE